MMVSFMGEIMPRGDQKRFWSPLGLRRLGQRVDGAERGTARVVRGHPDAVHQAPKALVAAVGLHLRLSPLERHADHVLPTRAPPTGLLTAPRYSNGRVRAGYRLPAYGPAAWAPRTPE